MTLRKTYEKNKQIVYTHYKFIYCSSVYQIWSWGAALIEETYISSDKPIILKKNQKCIKKSKYSIHRFLELQFAPEEWLISQSFKIVEDETRCN